MDKERPILDGEKIDLQDVDEALAMFARTNLSKVLTKRRSNRVLFKKFLEAVNSSGRYPFMGCIESTDELGSRRLAFYLLEMPRDEQSREEPLTRIFDPLADAVQPKLLFDLYFMNGRKYTPDQAWENLKQKYMVELQPPE